LSHRENVMRYAVNIQPEPFEFETEVDEAEAGFGEFEMLDTELPGRVLTYTTSDVIDQRISIPAQHALVRLSKDPATSADAVALLEEVKGGRLGGIFCVNWQKPAQRAIKLGKSWWTVIPSGEDAVLMLDPDNPLGGQPLIAFRRELDPDCGLLKGEKRFASSPARLEQALLKAWSNYQLWRTRNQVVRCDVPIGGRQTQALVGGPTPGIPLSNVVPCLAQIGTRTGTTFVTKFVPGARHDHTPTRRWGEVQSAARARCGTVILKVIRDPDLIRTLPPDLASECACALLSPDGVAKTARNVVMATLPLARKHLDHYLAGTGSALTVDLEDIIRRDSKVRAKLGAQVKRSRRGFMRIEQSDYAVKDFQFALGAIDRLDFEVNRKAGLVHVWFMDRYEWHPVGFGYKPLKHDVRRETNCIHAAMVELKDSGAADYWMFGDTVLSLSLF
jgi:hypothetical protein